VRIRLRASAREWGDVQVMEADRIGGKLLGFGGALTGLRTVLDAWWYPAKLEMPIQIATKTYRILSGRNVSNLEIGPAKKKETSLPGGSKFYQE